MKQQVFQRRFGSGGNWITYLAESFEDWSDLSTPTPEIHGIGFSIEESAAAFVKALDRAIKKEMIVITK
jgi:hypothetical protein